MRKEVIGDAVLYHGDCLEVMAEMGSGSVQCVVTSPPYWGLRDYGVGGQIGLEETIEEYISKMVDVFSGVWRVLKNDGTLWLNMGDCYAGGGPKIDIPAKNLIGLPWRVAFALQSSGWILRSDIIWSKPNPMPESVQDRPTKAHEYIFLFSKSRKYYYDADAIKTGLAQSSVKRYSQDIESQKGSTRAHGGVKNATMKAVRPRGSKTPHQGFNQKWDSMTLAEQRANGANKRSVWTVATKPFRDAHFATFPPELIRPCILAGSRVGDTVLDPFWGSGTTGEVAISNRRKAIGIELNAEYCELSKKRFVQQMISFA